jgi:hypothetical protein
MAKPGIIMLFSRDGREKHEAPSDLTKIDWSAIEQKKWDPKVPS